MSKQIDIEHELYKVFGQVKDFTLGMKIARHFYNLGAQQETASNDLKEAAENYSFVKRGIDSQGEAYTDYNIDKLEGFKAGALWEKKQLKPVSKDLEEAAEEYINLPSSCLYYSDDGWEDKSDWEYVEKAFKAGAQWKEQQYKDKLAKWEQDNEKTVIKYWQSVVRCIDEKRALPTFKGQVLHDFKNELNTIKQVMDLHNHREIPYFVIDKLALVFATWGGYHFHPTSAETEIGTLPEEPVEVELIIKKI